MTGIETKSASSHTEAAGTSRAERWRFGQYSWVWVGLLGLLILSAILVPATLSPVSLVAVLPFFAVLALAAVGQCLVIQQRGLDLSIPGTFAVTAIVMTRLELIGVSMPLALIASLGIAVLIGLVNGLVILKLSVSPLVATLSTNAILLGAAYMISGGQYLSSSPEWNGIARSRIVFDVPFVIVMVVVVIAVFSFLLRKSVPGRRFVLVGSNPAAARAAGIGITAYQLSSYVLCSLFAGIAGLLLTGFVGNATPGLGGPYLLSTVAAVVIGGTPLTGGKGSLVATAAGALLLSQLDQLTASLGAPQSTQMFVQAGVLVLAFAVRQVNRGTFDRLLSRSRGGLART
ncbi:ABC transporter permease [Arthrobacter sp. AK01]|uniref:ABC transporter permease n=1 Tax=Arthrobacter sp. AK01 TaxID=2894084 RepID=UPI001E501D8B|nr:ABC transporter permease [Arthrobacter sp. AK01]MCD4850628.1 ABC transporter permease [Arthrobacter sp. AK01]